MLRQSENQEPVLIRAQELARRREEANKPEIIPPEKTLFQKFLKVLEIVAGAFFVILDFFLSSEEERAEREKRRQKPPEPEEKFLFPDPSKVYVGDTWRPPVWSSDSDSNGEAHEEYLVQPGYWMPVEYSLKELNTHIHGKGISRTGKSKLIEHICSELLRLEQGFCLIDPNGELYWEIIRHLAAIDRPAILLDPSSTHRLVGFNPFVAPSTDETALYTKADRMKDATLRAWGATSDQATPRLGKMLRALYYTLLEQGLSITAMEYFLSTGYEREREAIIGRLRSERFRNELQGLYEGTPGAVKGYLESTANRFELLRHPQIQRVLGLAQNSIDTQSILDERKILLVNLQPSDIFGVGQAKVLGALLINEIWEITRRRELPHGKRDYFLIVDECTEFLTPDIPLMLSQAAKYGLRLMLFHQYDEQIPPDMRAAFQNARIKMFLDQPRKFEWKNVLVKTPFTESPKVSTQVIRDYVRRQTERFLTVNEINRLLAAGRQRIEGTREAEQTSDVTTKASEPDDEIFFE